MTTVYCDLNCKFSIDGICDNDEISFDKFGHCDDFTEALEPECPDKFYAFCIDNDNEIPGEKIARCWKPRMGIKETFLGREIFLNGYDENYFTDGRTGVHGDKKKLLQMNNDELNKIFNDIESQNGLSPLYTDNLKWPIKENDN